MSDSELVGVANKELIEEGVEALREVYEKFIHRKQDEGVDFKFIDGLMIGHNFYKMVMQHISKDGGGDLNVWMAIAISTLRYALENNLAKEVDFNVMLSKTSDRLVVGGLNESKTK